ncbi:hypothetical protein Hanom_Chr02g00097391 [Helianthus anomalus]
MPFSSLRFGHFCNFRPKVRFSASGSKRFEILPFLSNSLKMDGVNELDENDKISNLFDSDTKKQTFRRKLQKWSNLMNEKWHFTLL